MTKHEAAQLMRKQATKDRAMVLPPDQALMIADLLDAPKHPNPGSFVEFRFGSDPSKTWWPGIVSDNGRKPGVFDAEGELNPWDKIEYRRVYKVTPPPLSSWYRKDDAFLIHEHGAGLQPEWESAPEEWGRHVATITREQMERQNGIVDDGEMGANGA